MAIKKTTITEALADIKTIGKRIEKKRTTILQYAYRQNALVDPLAESGGSKEYIRRELQAINDLGRMVIQYRSAIQKVNLETPLTIGSVTMTVTDWLNWRKELAATQATFLSQARNTMNAARREASSKGVSVAKPGEAPAAPSDVIINIDEAWLAGEIENMETVLGNLDGQLSLHNAITFVEINAVEA